MNLPVDGVLFDCDSTLCAFEGIDHLAAAAHCKDEIAALTTAAMNGEIPLEDVYERRLARIRPSQTAVAALGARYLEALTPGAKEIVATLHRYGLPVGIVSGGLALAIAPVAAALGIAAQDLFAVALEFDAHGAFVRVCPTPLTTAQGKRSICAQWKAARGLSNVVLIGDGASDVAALGGADAVIAYGGIVRRPGIAAQASAAYDDRDLRGLLPLLGLS